MQLLHLGLTFAFGAVAIAFQQTVIPCGDDGNTISSCTVTATDQVVTLSRTVSTIATTITQSLAARRVEKVVVPAYSERYCLAQYRDLGPLALPDWDGSGICGARCDPPENDQYVQTVRVVECTQKARQSTKVCSEHLETWSRTATGISMRATLRASTRYNCPSAGPYTFQFSGTAPRTYTTSPGKKTITRLRNGRLTTIYGKPTTIWYAPAPYTFQVTKIVNNAGVINFQTQVTTVISVFLPTSTVTATTTITYTNPGTTSTTAAPSPTTSSSVRRTSTTQSPSATATPTRFYLRVADPASGQLRYVRFVNGQAKLVDQQDAISGGADTFQVLYGFLQNMGSNGGFGYLVGTSGRAGAVPILQYNNFPPGASQVELTPTQDEEFGFLIDAVAFTGAEGLCVDNDDNLYVVFSGGSNSCTRDVTFSAVARVSGAPSSTSSSTAVATVYVTVTTVYRGTGTVSATPFTTTVVQPTGSSPGTVQVLFNPTTVTNTITDGGSNTRSTTVAQQSGPTPGTVVVLVPSQASFVTITTVYRGSNTLTPFPYTSTISGVGGAPGTVEILYRPSTITNTITTDDGLNTRTSTIAQQSGPTPGTVDVFVPRPSPSTTLATYVTVTAVYRGTGILSPTPFTSTIAPFGNSSGTVQILYNPTTVTSTITDSGSGIRTSIIQEQTGSVPGTVDVFIPISVSSIPSTTTTTTSATFVTITAVYRGSGTLNPTPYTSTINPVGNAPGTIQILFNPNTVTSTITYAGNSTSTSTIEQVGSVPGTVDVFIPVTTISATYVTITAIYRGSSTLSPAPSSTTVVQPMGTSPGTVQVYYNPSTITTTTLDLGNSTRTSTITEQAGSTPGTVEIFLPSYIYVTTTSGSISTTSIVIAPSGTAQGTALVIVPTALATTSRTVTFNATYVTISTVYRGSGILDPAPLTSTISQPTSTVPGTVEIFYNPSTITTTTLQGNNTRTSTISEQTGSIPGLVEIFLPAYVTTSAVYNGNDTLISDVATSTIAQPSGTVPGTVRLLFKARTITVTTLDQSSTTTSTSTIAQQVGPTAGTVQVVLPAYTTISTVYRGSGALTPSPSTSTIVQATGTTQGTVDVFFSPNTVTITSADPTANASRTSTITEQVGPTAGTVEVFLPGYVTITTTSGSASTTSTLNAPTGSVQGTVLVLVPTNVTASTTPSATLGYVTITTTLGTVSATSTLNNPSGATSGTILIVVPVPTTTPTIPLGYVTITTISGAVSATSTLNNPSGTTSGTVLIVVPAPTTTTATLLGYVTITTTSGSVNTTSTLNTPSGTMPGTVLVVIPTPAATTTLGYVTVTTTSGSISATSTLNNPSGTTSGTVLVIIPTPAITTTLGYITITTTSGTVNATSTLNNPSGSTSGTVLVVIPTLAATTTLGYVTITTTSGSVSTVSTLNTPSGIVSGTVLVIVPATTTLGYTTITTTSGSVSVTSTLNDPLGATSGTVLVVVPTPTTTTTTTTALNTVYVTVTSVYRGTGTIAQPATSTISQPTGTAPGTVALYYNPSTITTTSLDTGSTTRTTTVAEQNGTTPGTVAVLLPAYVTITTTLGTVGGTSTINQATGTIQGTVLVDIATTAPVYTTITTVYRAGGTINPNPSTTTLVTASGTRTGTVEIFYNPATITTTLLDTGNTTRTTTLNQQSGSLTATVEVLLPSFVTITTTSGYQNRVTTLNTPSGTVQGTIEVIRLSSTVVYCSLNGASTAAPDPAATGVGSNRGIQYGIWDSPFFDSPPFDENTGFANYNTTYFDAAGRGANYTGQSPTITYSADANTFTKAVYSDTTRQFSTQYITLIHRGFLFARTAGTYTFETINPDDIVEVWVGPNAISGFTRANANIAKTYPAGTTTYTVALTAGQYMPFRIQWANGGIPASLSVQIKNPAGTILLDGTTSTDIVTAACDGSTPAQSSWYTASYVTTTTTSGYATTTGTTTVASAFSGTAGTVRVVVPTPIYCTSTTSVTSNAPGASATSNTGLQYGIWNNTATNAPPFPADQKNGYPNYNVAAFDNTQAIHVGTTNMVGFTLTGSDAQPNQVFEIYSDAPKLRYNIGFLTIIHRGFLFAREAGTYTFTSASADDITFLWTGSKAVSGFTRANADIIQSYYATTDSAGKTTQKNTPESFSISLTQGQYLPIRIQWADAGPPGELNMNVTGPDGGFRILRGQAMQDVITNGCGTTTNDTTPAFPAWTGRL